LRFERLPAILKNLTVVSLQILKIKGIKPIFLTFIAPKKPNAVFPGREHQKLSGVSRLLRDFSIRTYEQASVIVLKKNSTNSIKTFCNPGLI